MTAKPSDFQSAPITRATQAGEIELRPSWPLRAALVVVGLGGWFWTQSLIGRMPFSSDRIGDGLHMLTAPLHDFLVNHPSWANGLLIVSSAVIDLLALFLIARSIFGPSTRLFLGLMMLFVLRQICQGLCALPPPEDMIWHATGFPTLLVTYGVSNDFFFSGHTALAVYGAIELGRAGRRWLPIVGIAIALFEAATVLVLRAHYTMDVFAGAVTALLAASVSPRVAPAFDRALSRVFSPTTAR
jgi:membrane-associated phospholipid phosphatase